MDEWLAGHADEMVQLQAQLTARPALGPENGGQGEWARARFLEDYLQQCGLGASEHYDCPDERVPEGCRPNLAVSLPAGQARTSVWVLSHLDVVPPGERLPDGSWKGWDSDPWALRREGDVIYGRGVSDNQQSLVASVFAARAVRETASAPGRHARLLFVSDEETGSHRGLQHVLREQHDLFASDDLILVPDGGNEDGSMIEVAEKSVLWLEVRVTGRQAHASRPDRAVNALRAGSRLVTELDDALHVRYDARDELYEPPDSTFEPTMHPAGVLNVNTIPGEETFCFDCRVLPQYGLDGILEFVRERARRMDANAGTKTEVRVRNRLPAPPGTDPEAPVVRALALAVREVRRVEPRITGVGGQTVACFFRREGLPAAVWMTSSETEHQVNERCRVSDMVDDARVFARLFLGDR